MARSMVILGEQLHELRPWPRQLGNLFRNGQEKAWRNLSTSDDLNTPDVIYYRSGKPPCRFTTGRLLMLDYFTISIRTGRSNCAVRLMPAYCLLDLLRSPINKRVAPFPIC